MPCVGRNEPAEIRKLTYEPGCIGANDPVGLHESRSARLEGSSVEVLACRDHLVRSSEGQQAGPSHPLDEWCGLF